jgi:hypothetical protein
MFRKLAVLLAATTVTVVAACGGGSGVATSPAHVPVSSHEEFEAKWPKRPEANAEFANAVDYVVYTYMTQGARADLCRTRRSDALSGRSINPEYNYDTDIMVVYLRITGFGDDTDLAEIPLDTPEEEYVSWTLDIICLPFVSGLGMGVSG